ncbi:MAG: PilZ domain-containing protein [Sphingomicrobium sp.]
MTIEQSPNRFRASMAQADRESPVVAKKNAKLNRAADGLGGMSVPRTEIRLTNARSADRHRLASAGAIIVRGRRSYDVSLINISGSGAMIEGDLSLKLWETVRLKLGDVAEVECAVRWIRGKRYGLEFAHETRIDCDPALLNETLRKVLTESAPEEADEILTDAEIAEAATQQADPRRTATRHPLIWSGLIQFNHDTFVARLRNISASGAQIESAGSFPAGSEVLLDLGNAGTVPAMVRWSYGDHAGLAFEREFDIRLLAAVRPVVTPQKWVKPLYLQDESQATSPWAAQWGRLTLKELTRTLCG